MLPVFINLLRRLYFMRASRESAAYHSLPKEGIFMDQSRAPIMEALENFKDMRIVPFDVPGHKRGRGSPELTKFLGQQCMTVDVNSMKPLDNLCHPTSVIREAEELAADPMVRKVYLGQHFELKKSHQLTQQMKNRKGQQAQQAGEETETQE